MTNPPNITSSRVDEDQSRQKTSGSAHNPAYQGARPRSSGWSSLIFWLIVAGLSGAGWYCRETLRPWIEPLLPGTKPVAGKPPRVVPVSTAVVRQRDMPLYLNGLGTVTAFKTVTVRCRVDGELVKVAFVEGQMVNEGDLLAEIDPRPYEVMLAQAEGQLARDEASLKTARTTLSRYEGLLAGKSIAAQQYDDQVSLVNQTMATIQTDNAMIANAKLQITYSRIIAPITGRIGLRLVDQGNIVHATDVVGLAVITQLQPIALVFTIPQDDVSRVQKKTLEGAELTVDAFDRDFKMKLASGRLIAVDNQVDATTGTVRLKASFENKDGMLFPNQFVNARLLVDTKVNAVVVPAAAVQRGPTSMFVYVVKQDKDEKTEEPIEVVELRNVVTGPTEGAEVAIESGLTPGEVVVTDGIDKLQPKSRITTRAPGKTGKTGEPGKPGEKGGAGDKGAESGKLKEGSHPETPASLEKPAADPKRASDGPMPESARQKMEQKLIDSMSPDYERKDPRGPRPDTQMKPAAKSIEGQPAKDAP